MASRRPLTIVSGAVNELPSGDTVPGSAVDLSGLASLYQALDATLTALAGLATGANKFPYSTGTDTFSQADITAAGRALLDDADATAQVATLGLAALYQPLDSDLTTLASLTATTNNFIVSTSSAWASRTPAQAKTALAITAADVTPSTPNNFAYASTYAPNWSNGEHHWCALTGDITIQEPTNIPSGKTLRISLTASSAPRTVTIDSTISRLAGINSAFVVETGKLIILAIENNPAISDTLLIAKGGN